MTYTVNDISDRYGVNTHTVLGWIKSGDLRALNVGRALGKKKPRWRITEEALKEFELIRSACPPPPPVRRRKKTKEDTFHFYK